MREYCIFLLPIKLLFYTYCTHPPPIPLCRWPSSQSQCDRCASSSDRCSSSFDRCFFEPSMPFRVIDFCSMREATRKQLKILIKSKSYCCILSLLCAFRMHFAYVLYSTVSCVQTPSMYSVFRRAALTYVLHRCFDRQRPGLVFGDFNFRTDACSLLSVRLYSHHITSHCRRLASPNCHRQLARTLIY